MNKNQLINGCLTDLNNINNLYLLGFIWADGHVSKDRDAITFSITEKDFDVIQEIIISLGINCRYKKQAYTKTKEKFGRPTKSFGINNKFIANFLRNNDYHIKSGASPDKILSLIPNNLKHYWWRGYFDGDGSLCIAQNKAKSLAFWSVINQDWSFMKDLFTKLQIDYHIYKYSRKEGKHLSSVFETRKINDIKIFGDYIYQNYDNIGLKRKYDKYIEIKNFKRKPLSKTSKFYGLTKTYNIFMVQIWYTLNNIKTKHSKSFKSELDAAKYYNEFVIKNNLAKPLNIIPE